MHQLYHYIHCPYCLRLRMTLGYLKISYKSIVLPYNDEKTPISLIGKKMLPILKFPDGTLLSESLDIISRLDQKNQLNTHTLLNNKDEIDSLNEILSQIASPTHSLVMPYWMYTPEFDPNSRKYFQSKKEEKKGPFRQLIQDKKRYENEISQLLETMAQELTPYFKGKTLGLKDILLASHLWGLYIVPEFQFPASIHHYLQSVSEQCHFSYHEDIWA